MKLETVSDVYDELVEWMEHFRKWSQNSKFYSIEKNQEKAESFRQAAEILRKTFHLQKMKNTSFDLTIVLIQVILSLVDEKNFFLQEKTCQQSLQKDYQASLNQT